MAALKIKVDDQEYEIDPNNLTLGESWMLERDYGVDLQTDNKGFGWFVGLLAICVRRADPKLSERQARQQVEGLTDERLEVIAESEDDGAVPTAAGAAGKSKSRGKEAGTPASSGAQD